ncbi:hypothetical protein GKZ68_02890 [Hymenobacter sp. BRD128]|uniref:PID-CTERM protein-sorting domain-containing protein n=1 Tax=Hymenobacter sp. BRD128 TaxID=2675878 RepID=UPI001566AB09|nr:hypothetical protein [Hymenobacter sp. BRD128]QKG55675.1 hypothetical protein GKZ68_02890 [Hymenobacter sp. BRD128]
MHPTTLIRQLSVAFGLLLMAGASQQVLAQNSGGPTPQTPTAVPLDGGASLLLAGSVAYGLRKLRQRRK